MLQFFRGFLKSKLGILIALVFLGLVALAFASSDVAHSNKFGGVAGGDRVATVGNERIDTSALSQAATNALETLKQDNPRLSMQSFLATGQLDQVLDSMINRTAMSVFGKEHGIVVSDRLVDSEIAQMAAFKGPDGNFSETAFRQLLRQRGVSEALVRVDLAQGLVARQIITPAGIGATMPREMALRYAALLKERRSGSIGLLPAAAFAPTKPASDAELSAYYNQHRARFILPERRVIRFAAFGEEELKNIPAPTEAAIAARYNANKAEYAALETRRLTQLVVPTEAAAKAVADEVAKGKTLEAAATAKGLSTAQLGPLSKDALSRTSAANVADAAFAAARGALATPVRSPLGWHILRVDSVETRPARSLDQVRAELTQQLAAENKRKALVDFSARIEEEFDNGGTLPDVAKELNAKIEQTPPLTADGRIYENPGQALAPILAKVVQTAFAMERENQPQLAEIEPGKRFVIFDVTHIAPSAAAPLADIREDVAAAWLLDKGAAAAKVAAEKVMAEVRKGTPLQQALTALGRPLPPVQTIDMDRTALARQGQQPPPPLVLLFSMAQGTVKILPAPMNRAWFVVALKAIVPEPVAPNDPMLPVVQRELGQLAGREYAEQLGEAIRAEVKVTKNQTAIRAVRSQLGGTN